MNDKLMFSVRKTYVIEQIVSSVDELHYITHSTREDCFRLRLDLSELKEPDKSNANQLVGRIGILKTILDEFDADSMMLLLRHYLK